MLIDLRLTDILVGLETVLGIDYTKTESRQLINQSIRNIENSHNISLKGTVEDCLKDEILSEANALNFLVMLSERIKDLSLYLNSCMYNGYYGECRLKAVNYLGFAEQSLLTALKYYQFKKLAQYKENVQESILDALDCVELQEVKRLFIIMFVLDRIGVQEGASIIACLLYLGGQ